MRRIDENVLITKANCVDTVLAAYWFTGEMNKISHVYKEVLNHLVRYHLHDEISFLAN